MNTKLIASIAASLVCGAADNPEISDGIANVYFRFKQAGVPVGLHVQAGAGHGFGIRATHKSPSVPSPDRLRD